MKPRGPTPLADAVSRCIAPTLRKQGFGESEIVTFWPDIVGPRLSAASAPLRLVWPPGGPKAAPDAAAPATLAVRVEGAFALEVQHLAPLIVERVNALLGWRCVDRLTLRQGPLPQRKPGRRPPLPPDPAALAMAAMVSRSAGTRAVYARAGLRPCWPRPRRAA